ncbi:LysM peptidoglycan-binding domain-containing protein [Candidatus Microgenomates bacterium]|nr:LysM peptidoglycan-binding domain-containing protein [Candidatus Microgenomates bacterium]
MAKETNDKVKFTSESYISMALGLLVVIVVGVLIFNFFKAGTGEEKISEGEVITGEETEAESEASLPTTHKVVAGETTWLIAEKYFESGYNWVDIAEANNLQNPDYLEIGQELKIPEAEKRVPTAPITSESYTVAKGDNLWSIAVRAYNNGFAWTKIAEANNLVNPSFIHAGNILSIPR